MFDINMETEAIKKEVEIRGRFVMLACDIEFCMLNIILFCNPDPNNHNRVGQFKKMKMNEKINNVIADVKKYKPNYFSEYEKVFNGLGEFRIVRNDMSHNKGDFPNDPDLSIFRTGFIEKDSNGIEAMRYKDYSNNDVACYIEKFLEINVALSQLWMRLKNEFNGNKNPFVHPSTDS